MGGRVKFDDERCKGCMLCGTVCLKDIIIQSDQINKMGYKVAQIMKDHEEQCTGCAFCAEICPDCAIEVWRDKKPAKGGEK